jgi:hypothetical protein
MKPMLIAAAMTVLFPLSALADAMTFDLVRNDFRSIGLDLFQFIYADGEIMPGTADQLSAQLKAWGIIPGGWVYFNSLGGSPVEAMKLGEVIRSAGLETNIGRPADINNSSETRGMETRGICASACALAYLGGDFRYIGDDSVYAVHRFFGALGNQIDSDTAQLLSGLEVSYITRMGADPELFRLMTLKGKGDLTVVPHDLLRRFRVVTDAIKSTVWSIQNSGGMIYLRVVQEEYRGTNKLVFFCDPQAGLTAMSFLDTAYGPDIVRDTRHRGWMIDGDFLDIDQRLKTAGPTLHNSYVEMTTPVTPALLSRILSANRVGLATQSSNRDLFSGFEIRMDDAGRKNLSDFVKSCRR